LKRLPSIAAKLSVSGKFGALTPRYSTRPDQIQGIKNRRRGIGELVGRNRKPCARPQRFAKRGWERL
jgi:hypothetical protein